MTNYIAPELGPRVGPLSPHLWAPREPHLLGCSSPCHGPHTSHLTGTEPKHHTLRGRARVPAGTKDSRGKKMSIWTNHIERWWQWEAGCSGGVEFMVPLWFVVFLQYVRHETEQSLQRRSKKSLVFVSLGIINISIVQVLRAKSLSRGFLLLFYLVYST